MNHQVSSEVYALALAAAQDLKQQLEERLIGNKAHGWSCSCGSCGAGPSRVVGIDMPTSYPYQIAMWLLWSCRMEDDKGKSWSQGICSYIPWTELYPMYRSHFAGIDVEVENASVSLFADRPEEFFGDVAARDGRNFNGSGRSVIVTSQSAAYLRPVADRAHAVWINAELRLRNEVEQYVACQIDPFEYGRQNTGDRVPFYKVSDPSIMPTFYIRIPGLGQSRDLYFPIARLISVNKQSGEVTFELDQSVESFHQASE